MTLQEYYHDFERPYRHTYRFRSKELIGQKKEHTIDWPFRLHDSQGMPYQLLVVDYLPRRGALIVPGIILCTYQYVDWFGGDNNLRRINYTLPSYAPDTIKKNAVDFTKPPEFVSGSATVSLIQLIEDEEQKGSAEGVIRKKLETGRPILFWTAERVK